MLAACTYSNAAGSAMLRDSVDHGILDQGLQDQTGHEGAGGFRLDVFNETQTIRKSDPLDFKVVGDELDFHFERNFRRTISIERNTQQFTEPAKHVDHCFVAAFER